VSTSFQGRGKSAFKEDERGDSNEWRWMEAGNERSVNEKARWLKDKWSS
jgi:hypothetical protein